MEHLAPGAKPAGYVGNTKHTCPRCHGNLIRRPRRLIDRLQSLFTPVQRYRCDRFSCRWIGNIEIDRTEAHSHATPFFYPFQKNHMFTLLNILLVAVLLMLVLLVAISASMPSHPTADIDLNDALHARDNVQSNRPLATLTVPAAATPK